MAWWRNFFDFWSYKYSQRIINKQWNNILIESKISICHIVDKRNFLVWQKKPQYFIRMATKSVFVCLCKRYCFSQNQIFSALRDKQGTNRQNNAWSRENSIISYIFIKSIQIHHPQYSKQDTMAIAIWLKFSTTIFAFHKKIDIMVQI